MHNVVELSSVDYYCVKVYPKQFFNCFHTLSPRLHLVKAYFPPLLNMKGVHCIQLPLSGICIIWGQFKTDLTVNINLLSSAPDMVITWKKKRYWELAFLVVQVDTWCVNHEYDPPLTNRVVMILWYIISACRNTKEVLCFIIQGHRGGENRGLIFTSPPWITKLKVLKRLRMASTDSA